MSPNKLTISQIDRKIKPLRLALASAKVQPGWIRYMRNALGMKLKDLAKLTGLSVPTVAQSERREAQGKVTLETLNKIARAMECDFIYAFVPKTKIKTFLEKKATEKAQKILQIADTHMTLEDQKVSVAIKERVASLAEQLLEKGDVW